jgi:signal transduction histidine kinase
VPADYDDWSALSPDDPPLLKRLEELSAEFARQKARAAEAIERVRRNVETTQRERHRRDLARAGTGALRELLQARAAAERASEAKSRALAAVAHDLKQPLQVIMMAADRLRDALSGLPSDRGAAHLDRIDRSAGQIAAALDALLRLARSEFGPAPEVRPMPLEPVLTALERAHAPLAEANGLVLRCVPTRAVVRSDPDALSSILHNLVGNAIKYTDAGGSVLLGCRRRGADKVEIQVHDTGRGIPAEDLDSVFQSFTRLDETKPGVGLGLSIAKRHAEALGHELVCRSVLGKGSCFGVRIALAGDDPRP